MTPLMRMILKNSLDADNKAYASPTTIDLKHNKKKGIHTNKDGDHEDNLYHTR